MEKYYCDCGRTLCFLECSSRKGIDNNLVKVGCMDCNKYFYLILDDIEDIDKLQKISSEEWINLHKYGVLAV